MRTVEEAKQYIIETIEMWERYPEDTDKIISVASFTERRRNVGNSPFAKMKELQKNIKQLEIIIKRHDRINPIDVSESLDDALDEAKLQYNKLKEEHGEHKPRKRSKK